MHSSAMASREAIFSRLLGLGDEAVQPLLESLTLSARTALQGIEDVEQCAHVLQREAHRLDQHEPPQLLLGAQAEPASATA